MHTYQYVWHKVLVNEIFIFISLFYILADNEVINEYRLEWHFDFQKY